MACPEVELQWGFCLIEFIYFLCKSTGLVVLFFFFLFFSYRVAHGFNQIKNKTKNNNKQSCLFSFTSTEYVACTFAVLLWMFQYMLSTLLFSIRTKPLSPGETSPSLRQGDRNSQGAGVNPCDVEMGWCSECRPFFFFCIASNFSIMKTDAFSACRVILVFPQSTELWHGLQNLWCLTCVGDLFACVYTGRTSVYSHIRRAFVESAQVLTLEKSQSLARNGHPSKWWPCSVMVNFGFWERVFLLCATDSVRWLTHPISLW